MIGYLLMPDLEELIRAKRWDVLRDALSQFDPSDIAEILVEIPDPTGILIRGTKRA
jgi:magnesium transporter